LWEEEQRKSLARRLERERSLAETLTLHESQASEPEELSPPIYSYHPMGLAPDMFKPVKTVEEERGTLADRIRWARIYEGNVLLLPIRRRFKEPPKLPDLVGKGWGRKKEKKGKCCREGYSFSKERQNALSR
jgi:hypothetical protein